MLGVWGAAPSALAGRSDRLVKTSGGRRYVRGRDRNRAVTTIDVGGGDALSSARPGPPP